MMKEISLNILDIVTNSIKANATLIEITVCISHKENILKFMVKDNGDGMSKESVKKVEDPFYTTSKIKNVGFGVPFVKMAAQLTGGNLKIDSEEGVGTSIEAVFVLDNIDRMPLGNISSTMHSLIIGNAKTDFLYKYIFDEKEFTLDTREFRKILDDIPFYHPEVSSFIRQYLEENKQEVDDGTYI